MNAVRNEAPTIKSPAKAMLRAALIVAGAACLAASLVPPQLSLARTGLASAQPLAAPSISNSGSQKRDSHQPGQAPPFQPEPSAVISGDGEFRLLTVVAVTHLDDDGAADLIVSQQPDGLVSRLEVYVIPGRTNWPSSPSARGLGLVTLSPPGGRASDGLEIVGIADVNSDGRDDIAATRTEYPGPSPYPSEIYIYLGREEWPRGGTLRSPEITLQLPAATAGIRVEAGDIDGDGLNEVFVRDENEVRVMTGRTEWPSSLSLAPDITLTPTSDNIFLRDVTGDGTPDLTVNLDSRDADMAFMAGRSEWPSNVSLLEQADWSVGTGNDRLEARFVSNVGGSDLPDLAIMDGPAGALHFFMAPVGASTSVPDDSDWHIEGVDLTFRDIEHGDLTGDGVDDIIINRSRIFLGLPTRTGAYTVGSADVDATWESMPEGHFFAADLNGDGVSDAVINDPSARGTARAQGAGTISLFFGPVLTLEATPTPRPSPTATATTAPTETPATSTPTPVASPTRPQGELKVYLPTCVNRARTSER